VKRSHGVHEPTTWTHADGKPLRPSGGRLVEVDADDLRPSIEIGVVAEQGGASTPRNGGDHAVDHPAWRDPGALDIHVI
jgi:hypothetical protein